MTVRIDMTIVVKGTSEFKMERYHIYFHIVNWLVSAALSIPVYSSIAPVPYHDGNGNYTWFVVYFVIVKLAV